MSLKSRTTLRQIYLNYPYKYIDPTLKGVPIPYVSTKDISDHEYKLTFKEWKLIITTYFKHLFLYLVYSGLAYNVATMGRFQVRKKKVANCRTNWHKSKKLDSNFTKIVRHKNIHTFGYSPRIRWYRLKVNMKYKGLWKFNFIRPVWSKFSKLLMKDKTLINNYNYV